jgi:hypothetical protein
VSGMGLLDSHSTESHIHFNMFTVVVTGGGGLGDGHTGHTHIDVHLDVAILGKSGDGLLVSNGHVSSEHSTHIDVDVHVRHASVEGNVDTADFLRSPVSGDGDLDKLDFRIVDFNGAGDGRSGSAASVHRAGDFQVEVRADELTLGGAVEDVVVFLKVDQVVGEVEGLDLAVVTSLESGEIDGNQVAVTGATGLDTRKGSGDLSQGSVFDSTSSSQVDLLLKSENNVGVVELRASVIELHDNLSSFTRRVVGLFELGSQNVVTLGTAASLEAGSDFITNTLHGTLDGLSNNEVLLEFKLGFALERGFQDGFKLVADVSKISGTFLVERRGKGTREHESEGNGILAGHQGDPVVNGSDHSDDFMAFFVEFINVTGFDGALAVLHDVLGFSSLLNEMDVFSTNKLEVNLISGIGQEEVEIDFTSDGITTEISGLVSLDTDVTVASSFGVLFTHGEIVTH